MKKTLTIAALLLCCIALHAATDISASDPKITVIGRTMKQDGNLVFDWSGTMVKIAFKGTSLSMLCSDRKEDYLNIWIDKEPSAYADKVVRIEGKQQNVQLVSGLKKGHHVVTVQKRTEGNVGGVTLHGFTTDGVFEQGPALRSRHIEFIGDSYTCGYGTHGDDRSAPFTADTEDCNLAYGCILGRFFDADVNLVSHSGRGIIRNYDDSAPGRDMTVLYGNIFDELQGEKWDPSMAPYTPDIVVIYLGTNDFSTGRQPEFGAWCRNYAKLLRMVRAYYGEQVPILCVASKAGELMDYYVKSGVQRSGVPNVHWTAIHAAGHNDTTELGNSWHPNYKGQRKVAHCMAPYVSTLTGWELPFKAIE